MKTIIDKEAVGARIKQIRMNKGYTLEAFGKLFGAKKGNVQQWEKGRSLPNKERIVIISKLADLTVNEFLYGSIDEYLENNINILFRKNNILNPEAKKTFINDYKVIEKTKELAKEQKIDLNDIDSLDRICNDVIKEAKSKPTNIKRDKTQHSNNEVSPKYDDLLYYISKIIENYSIENGVTREQAREDVLFNFNKDVKKL